MNYNDVYECAKMCLRRLNDCGKRRTRWFVRIPEREKEYSPCKWEMSLSQLVCIEKIANANVLLQSFDEKEMPLDIFVRVIDPCKWVISVGAYQITIHGSPRKFLITEGILENNSIKGYQLLRYCEKFIDENGAKDFSKLKRTVALDGIPAHFQFC